MSVTLISFPDNMVRSDREFDLIGSTDFMRAGEEAIAIYEEMGSDAEHPSLLKRIERLTVQIAWLETWRYDDCQGLLDVGGCSMALSLAPLFLRHAVGAMPAPPTPPVLNLVH